MSIEKNRAYLERILINEDLTMQLEKTQAIEAWQQDLIQASYDFLQEEYNQEIEELNTSFIEDLTDAELDCVVGGSIYSYDDIFEFSDDISSIFD